MGEHKVQSQIDQDARVEFIRELLEDVEVLDKMLKEGRIESGITRIGAEQEFCLVRDNWRPATNATDILAQIRDPHFTTELAKYNLEINLDPIELKSDAFTKMETNLNELLDKAKKVATENNSKIILTGILPSIGKHELELDHMTPYPRYYALNERLKELRGKDFRLRLTGVDDLYLKHDSVMFEACNTSFQTHLQIDPHDFVSSFNWAQAISGPILGICVNSPILLGRELWSETRIALFQQSIDIRESSYALKDKESRVSFGDSWASGSVADIFRNEIARHKVIVIREVDNHALEEFEKGNAPKLQALNLFNSTIYNWNRACYGVGGGKAHVRIENRYIPSGPTVVDEMANFAFWVGLMVGRPKEFDHLPGKMDFKDAKSNFIKAARSGSATGLNWMGEERYLPDLILDTLLPIAYAGLEKLNIDSNDIERYMGIIEQRATGTTGSQWLVRNYRKLREEKKLDKALLELTQSIYKNQQSNRPVHEWEDVSAPSNALVSEQKIGHIMSTKLFTANQHDLATLTTHIMQWKDIHHMPVVDDNERLVGLLTWTHMERFLKNEKIEKHDLPVEKIMTKNVQTVNPSTNIEDAIKLMKEKEFGCLPVLQKDHLVGIVTIKDVIPFDRDQNL